MAQPSRAYTRLLNTLIDERIASAPRRSPWFHLTPDERGAYVAEVDRRLQDIHHTTLSVLAAQRFALDDPPRSLDEHLDALRQCRERMKDPCEHRRCLDADISVYTRQRDARSGFESAWRKALRLVRAGDGLERPCAEVLVRVQRLADLLQRNYEADKRLVLFARYQGWQAVADRYRSLLDAAPEQRGEALAVLEDIPAADTLPVHLSLLLMEERPGYVRMTVALVNPSPDGLHKDLYLDQGRLVVQSNGMMNFSFGTAARSLAWQQHYRLKHEPPGARSPTLAPIRSVLVRSALVVELLGEHLVAEHSQRRGFFSHRLDDGMRIRIINVDRRVPNQIGIEVLEDPQRLSELVNRYADIASFQTIALEDYAATWFRPDRDGALLGNRELERAIGLGEPLDLLELPVEEGFVPITPFELIDVRGGKHLKVSEVRRAHAHNQVFFERLAALRNDGEHACTWLNSTSERAAFIAQWLRVLDTNHLTPGGVLPVPGQPRERLRDIKGNSLKNMAEERALADALWNWGALEPLLFDLGERLSQRPRLPRLLENGAIQCLLAQAGQSLESLFDGMPYKARALRMLRLILCGSAGAEQMPDSPQGRELRRHGILRVLQVLFTHRDVPGHPDPWLLLNAQPDGRFLLIGQDKYRGYHQFAADPQHSDTRLMEQLDAPVVGGTAEPVWEAVSALYPAGVSVPQYWRFQLANSAFLLRNGYHSLLETLYPAALGEPAGPESIGVGLLALLAGGGWPGPAIRLILSAANSDLLVESQFSWLEPHTAG